MNHEFDFDCTDNIPIDLCACFDPIFVPPEEVIEEWNRRVNDDRTAPVPTLENTSHYVRVEGADYLMIRKTMIKISERFSENGKSGETLIENVIQYSAGQLKK